MVIDITKKIIKFNEPIVSEKQVTLFNNSFLILPAWLRVTKRKEYL